MEGPFKETLARVKPGWPLRLFITMTPEDGMGGWTWNKFYDMDSAERYKSSEVYYVMMPEALKKNGGHLDDVTLDDFLRDVEPWKRDAKIYGRPGKMSSNPYFRTDYIEKLEERSRAALNASMRIGSINVDSLGQHSFRDDDEGSIVMFRKPVPGRRYMMVIDSGGGVGRDYTVAAILDPMDKCEVAYFRSNKMDPEHAMLTSIMPLGKFYNRAIAIPESNGDTGSAVVTILRGHRYYPIYKERVLLKAEKRIGARYGYRTNESGARNLIYDAWKKVLREQEWVVTPGSTNELRFISEIDGRPDHPKGMNDDHFFALGIGFAVLLIKPTITHKAKLAPKPLWSYELDPEEAYRLAV